MATFVHLTPLNSVRDILRSGIKAGTAFGESSRVVYAMPVLPNFYVSHQWLRELKRGGQRAFYGVYFRIPDEQMVWVGRYNAEHVEMSAVEAVSLVMKSEGAEGYEVLIPRGISRKEIRKVRRLPQVLGWRYYPEARGNRPCGCPGCQRGGIKSRRIREVWEST